MSSSTSVKIKSSLSKKMAVPGGRTVAEALARAESGLDSHREAGLATMADRLAWLETTVAARTPDSGAEVYRVAAELLDMAGFFETGPFYQATFSLCDIADRMQTAGTWDWPSIAVHVRAMRLILSAGCQSNTTSETILQGLASVAKRAG